MQIYLLRHYSSNFQELSQSFKIILKNICYIWTNEKNSDKSWLE